MNELTIEQLKSLKVGDWVWVVSSYYNREGYYRRIEPAFSADEEILARFEGVDEIMGIRFEDYGTKWVAYKNKEQAEDNGKILNLPYKVGDRVYLVRRNRNWRMVVSKTQIIGYSYGRYGLTVDCACDSSYHELKNVFTDKDQAKRRLAELTKE